MIGKCWEKRMQIRRGKVWMGMDVIVKGHSRLSTTSTTARAFESKARLPTNACFWRRSIN